jgi:NTP pyrophosphatase (non-canonical NTP hydrolase)
LTLEKIQEEYKEAIKLMNKGTKSEFHELTEMLVKFRDARNWEQFHNSKDLALAMSIEAAELNELFLWKSSEDVNEEKLKEELADVIIYALLLARKHGFNVSEIVKDKIRLNDKKYPVDKARNTAKKYHEL